MAGSSRPTTPRACSLRADARGAPSGVEGRLRNHQQAGMCDVTGICSFTVTSLRWRGCRGVEQHRIETRFGPVDVRVYRLRAGWWPVALAGRHRLPADPSLGGEELPRSAELAVRRLAEVIDAMPPQA